ncbi:MAG TPA: RES family NAD+ phosphorylase [Chitinophagales bacterium]|nr:RES family NAD+ phosphorylase [Chitinophagales bacterium]
MEVYRIALKKWSRKLSASGNAARWNSKGQEVIYTAASRALASLENIVHRGGEGLNENFRVMIIDIPSSVKIETIALSDLPDHWWEPVHYRECRKIGDEWLVAAKYPVLKVPSAIILHEYNYLLNPQHPDFKKIKLKQTEDFKFDPRIKAEN